MSRYLFSFTFPIKITRQATVPCLPLEIDDQKLFETLDKLYDEAYSESEQMKDLVKELVPTYKIDRR
ncbi:MAG: hypothetical protein IJ400_03700 [Clostridia bacterium]|nr:hypothetical protein [Clostridia bacterium]